MRLCLDVERFFRNLRFRFFSVRKERREAIAWEIILFSNVDLDRLQLSASEPNTLGILLAQPDQDPVMTANRILQKR